MKYASFTWKSFCFLLAVLWLLYACHFKDEPEPTLPADFWGEASAEKNGQLWTAHPACWIDLIDKKSINIQLDSFFKGTRSYHFTESLGLRPIPPEPGTYPVFKLVAPTDLLTSTLSFWDDDQPLGDYTLLESDSNTNRVTLLSYDTLSKEIRGTFNLSYVVWKRPYPNTPDTIRFKNGQFHGKLIKK